MKKRKQFDEDKYYADWKRRKEIRERKEREEYIASLTPIEYENYLHHQKEMKESWEKHLKWREENERKQYEKRKKKEERDRMIAEGVEWWKNLYDGVMDNILFFTNKRRKEK